VNFPTHAGPATAAAGGSPDRMHHGRKTGGGYTLSPWCDAELAGKPGIPDWRVQRRTNVPARRMLAAS